MATAKTNKGKVSNMKQITKQEAREAEKLEAAKLIFETYHQKGGSLEVIIHRTSKSNLTWRYSVRLWYVNNSGLVDNLYLNYSLSLLGFGNLNKDGYLTGGGVGIERSFQIAYNLGATLAALGFSDPNLEANRQGYQISRYRLSY
jgi:hypothetical protein